MRPMRLALLLLLVVGCRVPDKFLTETDAGDTLDDAPVDTGVPSGEIVWARSLSAMLPTAVVSGSGGLVVSGYLYATADLGGQLLTSAGIADMVIASFTEDEAMHLYSVRHGTAAGSEFAFMDAIDSTGAPYINGVSYGDADIGDGPFTGGGGPGSDGYIGRYSAGNPNWVQQIIGPGEDKILATVFSANATIIGAGWFEQTANFNSSTLTSVGGRDIFFARFGTFTGTVDLVKQFGGTGRDELSSAAANGTTSFVLTGFFDDTIDFGGGHSVTATGGLDVWVAKFDASGFASWAVRLGGSGDDRDPQVAVDPAGDVYISASFTTQITLGTTTLDAVGGTGTDLFLAKLDGDDGAVAWAISIGTSGNEGSGRIDVDGAGHVALGMSLNGQLDGFQTNGGRDGFVGVFNTADGSPRWRYVYSTSGDDGAGPVTFSRAGDVLATVNIAAAYDFGVPIRGAPNPGSVLLRISL